MNHEAIAAGAFWLAPDFWPLAGVLAAFAALAALLIADGPQEVPFDQDHGEEEL